MRVEETITVDAPRDHVWGIVKDPSRYAAVLAPLVTAFDADDPEAEPGVRARYDMRVHVGSVDVGGQVEVVEYDPPRDIAWTSITGIEQRGRLRLREADGGRTRVTLRISYGAPGAILGTLAEVLSLPQVRGGARAALAALKRQAEGEQAEMDAPGIPGRLLHEAVNVGILARSGLIAPMRPDKVARIAWIAARWGASPAVAVLAGAVRHPDRLMIVDELGTLTWRAVDRRSDAMAAGLRDVGVCEGDRVGLMCRDHRGFVEATMAVAKLGADVLLLNTSFAKPQLTEVCKREEAAALIYDEEFAELVVEAGKGRARFVAWHDGGEIEAPTLESLVERGDASAISPPSRAGRVTILTSGTTGTPKGASRGAEGVLTLDPPASLLDRIPYREGQVVRVGAPLFHAWGFSNLLLGMALGSTFVLRRRFDPEEVLRDIDEHRCSAFVAVPVMLKRILDLPDDTRSSYDTSSLRAVAVSGSALPGDLALRWMDEFGDTLYNMYGSTEVATATLATPADLRAAPGTAGRPARGTVVRLYDDEGRPVAQGGTGRIFVGNAILFEGYTGGGSKDVVDGLMATGDLGRFDEAGRLFVQGRDDEMIVSGGENVFPKEVEDVLADHPAVADAACIGVEDDDFGQRLRAFVVLADGQEATEDELKEHVKSNLARYKAPREVVFVDELPRNPAGKVLKRELAALEPTR